MAKVVDLNCNDDVDVEVDDEVQSSIHDPPTHQANSRGGEDVGCIDPPEEGRPSFIELDNDCLTVGDSEVAAKGAGRAGCSLTEVFLLNRKSTNDLSISP